MRNRFFVFVVIGLCLASMACGDDEDTGGGAGCAHAQMLCEGNADIEIDCNEWDSAPASVKECAGNATSCDAVEACLFGG